MSSLFKNTFNLNRWLFAGWIMLHPKCFLAKILASLVPSKTSSFMVSLTVHAETLQ